MLFTVALKFKPRLLLGGGGEREKKFIKELS